MSLSTHVKRISLNQWRYYYNQLLFVDVPLSAHFMQELMPPKGNSPTVEIKPIGTTDEASPAAYDPYSEPLILEAQPFKKLTTQLPYDAPYQRGLIQKGLINIYLEAVLNQDPENRPVTAGNGMAQAAITTSTRSPLGEPTAISETPSTTLIGTFSEPLIPERAKAEIPEPLCQVSALLAGLMTR